MQQEMSQVYSSFQSTTSFMRPEILALGREQIDVPGRRAKLGWYRMFFDDILRGPARWRQPKKSLRTHGVLGTGGTLRSVFAARTTRFESLATGEKSGSMRRRIRVARRRTKPTAILRSRRSGRRMGSSRARLRPR
jgi:hypothetical protein